MLDLSFREVTEDNWSDFECLFEGRGGPKSCWCMVWRAQGAEAKQTQGLQRKAAMQRRVRSHVPIGILGYLKNEPVAWCSIAPRPSYRRLGGPDLPGEAPESIWSIACLFARREVRGRGITAQMIAAALAYARVNGAAIVEAYPVAPDSPSYRFMGFIPAFEAAGFHHFGVAGTRRHIMRVNLR